ncbi:MAG: carbamoyltransferase [Parcubacteria bacterium C7867-006]|nr:MAG: carbamoyltransferase [Parcubacteria bacterium C7867-006]
MNDKFFCAISYNVHDSSVSFAQNNKVVLVLEAERIFRVKRKRCDESEMDELIKHGLTYLGIKIEDISYWTMTTLQNPILFQKENIFEESTGLPKDPYWKKFKICGDEKNVLIINHHLAHAASYLMSDFNNAIITTCDGGGDYNEKNGLSECVAVFAGNNNKIERINVNLENHISGKFYGACSYFLYGDIHCEGKMMALIAYGKPNESVISKLKENFKNLNSYSFEQSMGILKKLFPDITSGNISVSDKNVVDFASSVQKLFCDTRIENIKNIVSLSKSSNLVMAGGVSLNLDLNTEIINSFSNMKHFIAPCCDDTGQSLGALCYLISEVTGQKPVIELPYLGVGEENVYYNNLDIEKAVQTLLDDGIVVLHNGKAEIGPRSLGNRSLIARPDKIEIKRKLSENIKQREGYRPIAPVVLEDKVNDYFIGPKSSPYMLYKYQVKGSIKEKIIGATHNDGSARAQTVSKSSNAFLYDLIRSFGEKTGIYVLLNTSLNLKG